MPFLYYVGADFGQENWEGKEAVITGVVVRSPQNLSKCYYHRALAELELEFVARCFMSAHVIWIQQIDGIIVQENTK